MMIASFQLLAGAALLYVSLKSLSESTQILCGPWINRFLRSRFIHGPWSALAAGTGITALVLRSSVTTLMAVGLVSSEALSLQSAALFIYGSNIGTTFIGLILMADFGLLWSFCMGGGLIIKVAFRKDQVVQLGSALFCIGQLFLGMHLMKNSDLSFPIFSQMSPGLLECIYAFLMGALLSYLLQSSALILATLVALSSAVSLPLEIGCLAILGANLGTTFFLLAAAYGGGHQAQRSAWIHTLFNGFGLLFFSLFFQPFLELLRWTSVVPGYQFIFAHFLFNFGTALVLFPLRGKMVNITLQIVPTPETKTARPLLFMGSPSEVLPETALLQAEKELEKFFSILRRMANQVHALLQSSDVRPEVLKKILHYEDISDRIQKEVVGFIGKVMEKSLSNEQSRRAQAFMRVADEYESIADYLERLAMGKNYLSSHQSSPEIREEFFNFFHQIWEHVEACGGLFAGHFSEQGKDDLLQHSAQLHRQAETLRDHHLLRVSEGEMTPSSALTYSDMIVALRKIRSHALNVAQAYYYMELK